MLLALALLSAALLAYQVVLVHLLSITHWSHFAALVISLSLLGFGASGSVLAVLDRLLAPRRQQAFEVAILLTALSFDPLYRLSTSIPFDAFELLAVPRQFLLLSLTYLVLSLPFFFGASAIALAFLLEPGRIARLYAANLAGSGVGAVGGLALISMAPAERLPAIVSLVALAALVPLRRWAVGALMAGAALVLLAPPARIPMSSYKEESVALAAPESRLVARRDGPLGRLDVVAGPTLRYLPGASLALPEPVPPRPVLYVNGQPLGFRALPADSTLIGFTTAAALTALTPAPGHVLLTALEGGGLVWHARASGARAITVVDPDERIDRFLTPGTIGPDVRRVHEGTRGFLDATRERFDRIVVPEMGSLGAVAAGMAAAGESYVFTVEGVRDLWLALDRGGALGVTRWIVEPPRDVLRLLATVRVVLDEQGLRAADHVAIVRSWGTVTLLVSRAPLDVERVARLRAWCEERWFDVTWAPGVSRAEANRFNLVEPDLLRQGAEALLGPNPDGFIRSYRFNVAPVHDEAPFFFHFLPLGELTRLWRSEGRLSLAYFEWGVIAQALALFQAIPLAALLILAPLAALPRPASWRRRPPPAHAASGITVSPTRLFLFFALLGAGYMLLEISFIQRLVLFLAQPVYATTAVLAAFLVFSGLGSALAPRALDRLPRWTPFAAIALWAPLAYLLGDLLMNVAAAASLPLRLAGAVFLLAPLAFFMGMPFPIALGRVALGATAWVPWCWAVNGYLSVIGAAAAPLLALGIGLPGVLAVACALYLLAGWLLLRL